MATKRREQLITYDVNQYRRFNQCHYNMHHKKYSLVLELMLGVSLPPERNKPKIDECISCKGQAGIGL